MEIFLTDKTYKHTYMDNIFYNYFYSFRVIRFELKSFVWYTYVYRSLGNQNRLRKRPLRAHMVICICQTCTACQNISAIVLQCELFLLNAGILTSYWKWLMNS